MHHFFVDSSLVVLDHKDSSDLSNASWSQTLCLSPKFILFQWLPSRCDNRSKIQTWHQLPPFCSTSNHVLVALIPNHYSKPLVIQNSFLCVSAQLLSCVWLFVTLWTVTCQAPLSMGFFQVRIWEWVSPPLPPPGYLLDPGTELTSHVSCIGRWVSLPLVPPGKPRTCL